MYFSLLMTFGPVAAALSGLIGVVFVLGRRATGNLERRFRLQAERCAEHREHRGASYVPTDLAQWLDRQEMEHVGGALYHQQTQGKIERWHQTLKNRILLEHYYLPGDLERQVAAFVAHYNHARYHESLDNLTPADVYFGRAQTILLERERIKRQTIANRRLQHQLHAA